MSSEEVRGQEHLAARRAALHKVFRAFASRWPYFFGPARADELLPVWLKGVAGIDVALLEPAAIELAASTTGRAPEPRVFGDFARAYGEKLSNSNREYVGIAPASIEHLKDANKVDALGRRAYHVLLSWRLVGEVWALLYSTAPHDDQRTAVREGRVPYDVFDDAVAAVKRGVRAKPGPLATAIPA